MKNFLLGKRGNELGQMETIIGPDTVIHGTITTKNSLRVEGVIEGGICEANGVVIGASGAVNGNISARLVVVAGKVAGNINAAHSLEIQDSGHVQGDIQSSILSIGEGAVFEGACSMVTDKSKASEVEIGSR